MTKYYRITEKELFSLIECKETCLAMGGELQKEADAADKAVKAICKRNNMTILHNYSASYENINT
jgi:hypothetical protein